MDIFGTIAENLKSLRAKSLNTPIIRHCADNTAHAARRATTRSATKASYQIAYAEDISPAAIARDATFLVDYDQALHKEHQHARMDPCFDSKTLDNDGQARFGASNSRPIPTCVMSMQKDGPFQKFELATGQDYCGEPYFVPQGFNRAGMSQF